MPASLLNANNIPEYHASENATGLEWVCPNLNADDVASAVLVLEQVQNWQQLFGTAVAPYNGSSVTVTAAEAPATGSIITFDWPNPPASRPIGMFIAYWRATDGEGHVLDGGIIQFEITND